MREVKNLILFLFIITGFTEVMAQTLVIPEPNSPITPARERAALIYQRLTGVKIGIDAQILKDMEALISAGNATGAAALITGTTPTNGVANFYDTTVRQLATRMSTREESVKAPLSDFVVTFIGITRDDKDARDLVRGNYYYAGTSTVVPVRQNAPAITGNVIDDIIRTNNHYDVLNNAAGSLRDNIEPTPRVQQITGNGGTPVNNPDPAGVITSRAFTQAHAVAGTNRRMVHFTFKEFLCVDMSGWATADAPDNRVGPDVERAPGGDPLVYINTCKTCHGNMDGMRSAFANIDFSNGVLKNGILLQNTAQNYNNTNAELGNTRFASANYNLNGLTVNAPGVSSKYIRNANVSPTGYFVTDASWINTATTGNNATFFGWRGTKDPNGNIKGYGVKQFGTMIGDSEAFSRCMVRRVFDQVCKRETSQNEINYVRSVASEFEANGYQLRKLFQRVVTSDECIGRMQ